jgi:multiple sugar transport system ATP-binding protein
MNKGVLQQVGSPQELYENPVNVFVAAFIGSPAMNFATAKAHDGALKLGQTTLDVSGKAARAAEGRQGQDVLIGFRPEDMELGTTNGAGRVLLPAQVDVVEYLGHEELIHGQAEGHEIVALVPSDKKVQPGDRVDFAIAEDKLHVFDPQTEERLVAA